MLFSACSMHLLSWQPKIMLRALTRWWMIFQVYSQTRAHRAIRLRLLRKLILKMPGRKKFPGIFFVFRGRLEYLKGTLEYLKGRLECLKGKLEYAKGRLE